MKTVLLFCFSLLFINAHATEGATISGNTSVWPGDIETYNVSWESWNSTYQNYANVGWDVTGGTIISSDKTSVTIQWNTLEGYLDGTGSIAVNEDLGGQNAAMSITITNSVQSASGFCSGILGPAKVFVDFGSGSNPGAALASGTTTYQYNSSCALDVGQYTIVSNSNLCRSLWHNIPSDHTGNTNGYFLMLNASNSRNEIYRTTVTGLTTSLKYEFSAWVGNLYNVTGAQQDPNIRFEIYDPNGFLIASSGTIVVPVTSPTFQWQKIGFMFDLPPNVSSVQVVVVNARSTTTNEGNDMVIDDISFAPCYPGIIASYSSSSIVDKAHTCNSGTVNLYSSWPSAIPFANPSYQWQRSADDGASWTNISGATTVNYTQTESAPGVYQYRMFSYETSNPSQNIISNGLIYYVQMIVVDALTTNFYTCNGASASGQMPAMYRFLYSDPADAPTHNYTFLWSPSTYISNPNTASAYITLPGIPPPSDSGPAQPPVNYTYTFTVTNANYGCSASNTQTASVINPRKIGVPNAFSPNGDGVNEVFVPINIEDYPGSTFSIYNRWGTRVFYSEGPTKLNYTWDGTYYGVPQPQEVYFWVVTLKGCPNNIISSSGEGVPHGDVTLLR